MAAAVSIAGSARDQDPPETTGACDEEADAEGAGEDEGACAGEDSPFELLLDDEDGWFDDGDVAAAFVLPWPWNDLAAASEIPPVSATAPAISQRLTREISAKPALRALTDRGLIVIDGRGRAQENAKPAVRKRSAPDAHAQPDGEGA